MRISRSRLDLPRAARLAVLVTSCFLAGCDLADDGHPEGFGFDVQVSGEFQKRLTGTAAFAVVSGPASSSFMLQLQADAEEPFVLISLEQPVGARPAVGTYALVGASEAVTDPARQLVAVYTRSQQNPFLYDPFHATSGSLTITESGDRRLAGTVDFAADAGSGRTIRVAGSFTAQPGR